MQSQIDAFDFPAAKAALAEALAAEREAGHPGSGG